MSESPSATSRLRLLGYGLILTALAFSQGTGRIVADSKFDLVEDPWGFLRRSLHLWDPQAAFGQIQNQAAGYLLPMGPFFGLGHSVGLPGWVVQRLWWAVLLNVAFFGVLVLVRELRIGRPWTQVAAAAAYVLAPRMTSLLGATSVELWPTAVAPWVLIPLIRGSREGSVLRSAALSALAVAACGGVNATAVSAVLPMGVIWILTRSAGPRRWRLLAAWASMTAVATLWWSVPLVLQGQYAAPFLDYIETARVTQSVTGLADSILGTSNWAPYLSSSTYPAGAMLLTTSYIVWDAAAIAALGLLGLTSNPHRRFVVLSLLTGLVLVGLGNTGEIHGWWAGDRKELLDGILSPFRNSHKYDVVVRLSLTLGLAHGLTLLSGAAAGVSAGLARRSRQVLTVATAVALCGLAVPWVTGRIAPSGAFSAVPSYWREVATYLERDGGGGTALVMPSAAFGDYTWGSPHDDVMQPLARSRWAVRNVVPLAQPGNVALMDTVTEALESGRGSMDLAPMLARAGVSELVVRNDLDRLATRAPDPVYVLAALDASPGLSRARGFGPLAGALQSYRAEDGTRVVQSEGLAGKYRAVEIYHVDDVAPDARMVPLHASTMGAPGRGLQLTGDVPVSSGSVVLTDSMRARTEAFAAVRDNQSETQPPGRLASTSAPETFRRIFPDQERWQATVTWSGASAVTASSSRADATAGAPRDRGSGPGAAIDGDPTTAWRSDGPSARQWLQVDFAAPTDVGDIRLQVPAGASLVGSVRVLADDRSIDLPAPRPGEQVTWNIGVQDVTRLRVVAGPSLDPRGWWGISELHIPGVTPQRILRLPDPPADATVSQIRLQRDAGANPCPDVAGTVVCQPYLGSSGEDGLRIDRLVNLSSASAYDVALTGSLRRDPDVSAAIAREIGVGLQATGSAARDVAESPIAMIDGNRGTSWRASDDPGRTPSFHLDLPEQTSVHSLTLAVGEAAAVSAPSRVSVSTPGREPVLRHVDENGRVELPGWRTKRLSVAIEEVRPAFTITSSSQSQLPPGISEIEVNDTPVAASSLPDRCGTGPVLELGQARVATALQGSLAAAVRGDRLPVRVCGASSVHLAAGRHRLTAEPSRLGVADSLTLTRAHAAVGEVGDVAVRRDARGNPLSADLSRREAPTVLALPQNFNAAWSATLDGRALAPQRVDGWQQGWVVPAGGAGVVRFEVSADRTYRLGLLAGVVGLVVTAAVAALAKRRREPLAPLGAGTVAVLDVGVVVAAMGLLAGWPGVALTAAVWGMTVLLRRPAAVGPLAAIVVLPAALQRLDHDSWSEWLAQGATLSACALVAGSLLANGPAFLRRRMGRSSQR